MRYLIRSAQLIVIFILSVSSTAVRAYGQDTLDTLPPGWQTQTFNNFISIMHTASVAGLSDSERALAASQWMDANDWQSGSRKHRVQLVELLNSDLVPNKLQFSARWTGYLVPNATGTYTLSLWDYYKETALDTKVWVDGNLVLDCSGPESERVFRSGGVELTASERVPIRIEMRFHRTVEHKIAKPNVILSWESQVLPRQIIPTGNYQPPDDYTGQGSNGLKGEYFSSDTLEDLVTTRLDPELSYVWEAFAIVPEYGDRQRQIVDPMIPEILASLNDPEIVGMDDADAFWCAYALEEVLTTRESMRVLSALKNYPALNAARSTRDLFLFYWRFRYLPDHLGADLVAQWCAVHPLRESQFGTYPNYDYSEFYGNYNYPWRLGNHLILTGDDAYLEPMLDEADGSCNVSLASVLSFAHQKAGTLDDWYDYLESQFDNPALSGDVKASWMLARGFAEEIRLGGEPIPTAGLEWLAQAYVAAGSEQMKRHILRERCTRLAAADRGDEAHALLDEAGGQHDNPEAQIGISQWRETIDTLSQRFVEMRAAESDARKQAYIDVLQRRLDNARSRGDSGKMQSIMVKLQQVQARE